MRPRLTQTELDAELATLSIWPRSETATSVTTMAVASGFQPAWFCLLLDNFPSRDSAHELAVGLEKVVSR